MHPRTRAYVRAALSKLAAATSTDEQTLAFFDAIDAWHYDNGPEPDWDTMQPLRRKLREKLHVQALPDLLETLLLQHITESYDRYRKSGGKEPSLTAALLREVIGNVGQGWSDLAKTQQTKLIEAALKRLKTKGKLTTSLGLGLDGREAHLWEPK